MKKGITVLFAVLAIAGSYLAYAKYEENKFVESLKPHVKNSSLRLANALRYETEEATKITYQELFEKLEADIAEVDKRILEVQTSEIPRYKDKADTVLAYLRGSQELLRCVLMKYRKQLAYGSAVEWATKSLDELKSASYYGFDSAYKSSGKAIDDINKAEKEYSEAVSAVLSATKKMRELRIKAASVMPVDTLVDAAIFEAFAKKYEPAKNASETQKGQATSAENTMVKKEDIKVEVPDFVKGKWKDVKIEVLDKHTKQKSTITIPINSEAAIIGSKLMVKAESFLPEFRMEGAVITSASNEPKNPAVEIIVTEKGKEIFRGWIFSLYPDTAKFEHPGFALKLVGYAPVS